MIYKLNNVPIGNYGAVPTRGRGRIALDGLFDLPKRVGNTEHVWGTSVEPFVQAEDIELDGRLLTLHTAMRHDKVSAFISACFQCTAFAVDFDSFNVVCRDEIEVERIGDFSKVIVKFWQNDFALASLTKTPSTGGDWRIDDYDLKNDFGIYISEANKMQNGGKRIEVNTTEFYTRTNYRSTREIQIECFIKADSMTLLYSNMRQFQSLLLKPGTRTLKANNNLFEVYFKDEVKVVYLGDYFCGFTIKGILL